MHRLTSRRNPHQNGTIERKHIVKMGLTLLYHASLPLTFWDHISPWQFTCATGYLQVSSLIMSLFFTNS